MNIIYKYKPLQNEDKTIKIHGFSISYLEKIDDLDDKSKVKYWTEFKPARNNKNCVLVGTKTYLLKPYTSKRKITGFFETEDGELIAFYKESLLSVIMLIIFWLLLLLGIILHNQTILNEIPEISPDDIKLIYELPEDIIISGEDGTDVKLIPESELEYATYWGYQSITINKDMKVPFVNKESNKQYMLFTVYDKDGNEIASSNYIPPGKHWDWDAYSYYKGKQGEYLHDIKITWCTPVYDNNNNIINFKAGSTSPKTPNFKVIIQ